MTPRTVAPQRPLRSVQRREGSNTQAARSVLSSASGRYASAKDGAELGSGCTPRYLFLAANGT